MSAGREGNKLTATQKLGVVNWISNTSLKSASVFLDDRMFESCPLYNYMAYTKMLTGMKLESLARTGRRGYFYDDH